MDKNPIHKDRSTDLGTVRISNDAIATIASLAAMEVSGVHKMGGGATRTFCEHLFKRTTAKGIKIDLKDSEARLTISIIAEYGADIPRIADEVQENVKRAVEKMTGLVLSEVDVAVEGVYAEHKKQEARRI